MKNKKFLYTLLVLVLVLAIGIGYAALSKDLLAEVKVTTEDAFSNGTTPGEDPLNSNFKVQFDDTKTAFTISTDAKVTTDDVAVTYSGDALTVTIEAVNFYQLGDTITVPLTIVNNSQDLDAKITFDSTRSTTTGASGYFTVVSDWADTTIVAGGAQDFTLTIKVANSPLEPTEETFTFTFLAEAVPQ